MTITVTPAIIESATQGSVECPIFRALVAAGLAVHMVGCGLVHDRLVANAYLVSKGDSIVQPLPAIVAEAIKTYDKTGVMTEMTFDLPDL